MSYFDRIGSDKYDMGLANDEGLYWSLPAYESMLTCGLAMFGDIATERWIEKDASSALILLRDEEVGFQPS
jgi:hypothetical protein